jgi:putative endonuclease
MDKSYCVYILCNKYYTVLYVGVTSDLKARVYQHKEELVEGFTKRYKLHRLVYYEVTDDVISAISREKQIKNYSRKKKMDLIDSFNPHWEDLYDKI